MLRFGDRWVVKSFNWNTGVKENHQFNPTAQEIDIKSESVFFYIIYCDVSFSIAITSLGEERANLSALRTFVRFALVWFCLFPLPFGVWEGLQLVIMALPGLFSYLFYISKRSLLLSVLRSVYISSYLFRHRYYTWNLYITKTCLYYFDPLKPHFYIVKLGFTGVYIICLIFVWKHRLWVLVRTASLRRF